MKFLFSFVSLSLSLSLGGSVWAFGPISVDPGLGQVHLCLAERPRDPRLLKKQAF